MEELNDKRKMAGYDLSPVNAAFLEFVKKNPQGLIRSNYRQLIQAPYADVGAIQPWPIFIHPGAGGKMQEAALKVFNLIKQIPQRIFDNNHRKISAYYGLGEEESRALVQGLEIKGVGELLARGDFIFSPSGIKCVEFNITAGLGGWQLAVLGPLYLNSPVIAAFLREYKVKIKNKNLFLILLDYLFNAARDHFSDQPPREVNIAIAIKYYEKGGRRSREELFFNEIYRRVLKEKGDGRGGELILCNYSDLRVEKDFVFYREKRIHVLLECYHGEVPLEILSASLQGNLLLYNGPITRLFSNKLNLVLLSENEDTGIFAAEEREDIKRYIPWTRRVVPGQVTFAAEPVLLENFMLTHREKLVLKPADQLGGKDVYVGKYTPPAQWEAAAGQALADSGRNWIVQEYVDSYPYLFQKGEKGYGEYNAVWGLFVFGPHYAGGFLRIMPAETSQGVINTARGAEKTIAFEVEP